MRSIFKNIVAALCFVAAFSCSEINGGGPSEVTFDTDGIELPAEFVEAYDTTVTIKISSNRSWFAHLNDIDNPIDPSDPQAALDWATLDVCDHENLTRIGDCKELHVTIDRNMDTIPHRGALNIYCEGKVFASLPIFQKAIVYHLSAQAERSEALCTPDTILININSNAEWSARIDAALTTAAASLSDSAGVESGSIKIFFEENFELKQKQAVVRLSSPMCDDYVLTFTQSSAIPYIKLDESKTKTNIPATESQNAVHLKTNCSDVSASINAGCELKDASIEKISNTEFLLKFTREGADPAIFKKASVTFSAVGAEDLVVNMKQNGLLLLDFTSNANFTPGCPTANTETATQHTVKADTSSYSIELLKFYFRANNNCLMFSRQGYLAFPAISGLTLKKIRITFKGHSVNHSAKLTVKGTGDDKATAYSKADIIFTVPTEAKEVATYDIVLGEDCVNQPQPGVAYRVCQGYSQNCLVNTVELQYDE